jgi:predicted metal-binding protein
MNQVKIIIPVIPVIDYSVRGLCMKPYLGHKKGCPNYGKKNGCPPGAKCFDEVYDLSQPVYAIINKFDFARHVSRMYELHPEWSQRQLECCLYWQPKARNQLLQHIKYFLKNHPGYRIEACPEAMGVDVTNTLARAGVLLEWPPKQWACQVALAGILRKAQ